VRRRWPWVAPMHRMLYSGSIQNRAFSGATITPAAARPFPKSCKSF
jgi:hypothetical protein